MGFIISTGFSRELLFFALLLCPFILMLLKRRLFGSLSKIDIGHFVPFFLAVIYFKLLQPYGWEDWERLYNWLGIFELSYIMLYTTLSFLLIYDFVETSKTLKDRMFAYQFIGFYIILFVTYYKVNMEFALVFPGQRILAHSLAGNAGHTIPHSPDKIEHPRI